MDIQQEIFKDYTKQLYNQIDNHFIRACELWDVNINDKEEAQRRVEIKHFEGDKEKRVYIDGKLVFIFTDWEIKSFELNEPFTVKSEMQISKIMKPCDYGIHKLNDK